MRRKTLNHEDLDSLSAEFFREFARYEYCLKAVGFLKRANGEADQRDAQADWRRYADEPAVRRLFAEKADAEFAEAVNFYLVAPPRKQVVKQGVLDWDAVLPDHGHEAELVLQLICRTRNNLFHGGKFNGHWFEPQRSLDLLRRGLTILAACAQVHERVRQAYAGQRD